MITKETMYTLGQICRCIWTYGAASKRNPVPQGIIELVTTQPATGLAMMIKQGACTPDKQDDIGDLVDKLNDIEDPKGGVPAEIQGAFWIGYYHYASAIAASKKYGADELTIIGQNLYGDRWQTDLAKALGLSDARRIRQWLTGDRPIPPGVWADLAAMLRQREQSINNILSDLTNQD